MSLKLVPLESFDTVSYSPSIVTNAVSLAISEIFSVKQWPQYVSGQSVCCVIPAATYGHNQIRCLDVICRHTQSHVSTS